MLTVIATPDLGYIDKRCLTPGCNGKRLSMHRCVRCAESLMRRLRRTEARKLWFAKPSPQNGRVASRGPATVLKTLCDHPGSTHAELVALSSLSRAVVERALRALVAVGEARREPGSGRALVYFLSGVL
ncbi:hypothetical protein LCGC14_0436950 [marine sediment metagenome]|uniref:HTH marR-type domain-containing protein n=1 Tax=marine sediment metagenome TaxID=412755 RepID=A0A0F9V8L1_9ZZZZ